MQTECSYPEFLEEDPYKAFIGKNSIINQSVNLGSSFIFAYDLLQSKLIYLTENFDQLTGYSSKLILKNNTDFIQEFLYPDDQQNYLEVRQAWADFFLSLSPQERSLYKSSFDFRLKTSCGGSIRLLYQFLQVFYEKDRIKGWVVKCSDITHWKKGNNIILNIAGAGLRKNFTFCPFNHKSFEKDFFTQCEKNIIALLAEGLSSKEISRRLHITFNTANTHRRNLLKKAKVKNTNKLVSFALNNHLV